METTSSYRSVGATARNLRWVGVALLVAGLTAAPMFARTASAQRPAAVQASAFVINSYIATGLRADSVTAPTAAVRAPVLLPSRQIRVAGFGVLDVRSGEDMQIRVASLAATAGGAPGSTIQVTITYLGN